MKKFLVLAILFVVIGTMTAGNLAAQSRAVNNSAWDQYAEFKLLPKPNATLFVSPITDGYRATLLSVSKDYMLDYIEQVKSAGFTEKPLTEVDGGFNRYTAQNADGYKVVVISGSNNGGSVDMLRP